MLLALATLFGLGLYHGVGPDHCLAIGALAARGGMRSALWVSVRFGFAHSLVLGLCAVLATLLGVAVPARWESALEVIGGLSLFALGIWSVFSARALVPHLHEHPHTHDGIASHRHSPSEAHTHEHNGSLASLAGAVFSLSGVRGLLLLLPFVMRQRPGLAALGVSAFGLGVVCSMIAFGWVTQRVASATARIERGLRMSVGVASMVLGSYWVFDHLS